MARRKGSQGPAARADRAGGSRKAQPGRPPAGRAAGRPAQPEVVRRLLEAIDPNRPGRDRVVAARFVVEQLRQVEGEAWAAARSEGDSWQALADAVGISRSGAQQRAEQLKR